MAVTAVVGAQWGDEGKGKIVDLLAENADLVIRATGGNNAGHTIQNKYTKDMKDGVAKLHIVPAGIFNPDTVNIIGAGCALDVPTLAREITELRQEGVAAENLLISRKTHLVMPWHIMLDEAEEKKRSKGKKIGTTKRGMGPVFSAKYARRGLRAGDLLLSNFERLFIEAFNENRRLLNNIYGAHFYGDSQKALHEYMQSVKLISDLIGDSEELIAIHRRAGSNILLEGAQGVLLDIDHGTYPFVTSSACGIAGLSQGSGIPPSEITERIAVVKAYSTRVGAGAFPTKLEDELDQRLREFGNEFGATTGRPRMCGWLDLPLLEYADQLNNFTSLAITKLDILSYMSELHVGVGYASCSVHSTGRATMCSVPVCGLEGGRAYTQAMKTWTDPLTDITKYRKLPKNTKKYIRTVEEAMNTKARYISVGPHRQQTIKR
ncbi:MAG: adenylosuccinate synthase [Candidatus Spechtbacterales bacterium]|nr:adenylosuccinate synthase [Candidatus Spechtbacterales bacterium]